MEIKVNCKYNRDGVWCKNTGVKRLLGIGMRCCVKFGNDDAVCHFFENKSGIPPAPPSPLVQDTMIWK